MCHTPPPPSPAHSEQPSLTLNSTRSVQSSRSRRAIFCSRRVLEAGGAVVLHPPFDGMPGCPLQMTGECHARGFRTPSAQHAGGTGTRDASEGKGPQRRAQQRLDRRLEGVAKAVAGGYCRLQMPLKLAPGVRETAAGHRLGALEGGKGHMVGARDNA